MRTDIFGQIFAKKWITGYAAPCRATSSSQSLMPDLFIASLSIRIQTFSCPNRIEIMFTDMLDQSSVKNSQDRRFEVKLGETRRHQ
jgi:hypothetical protein